MKNVAKLIMTRISRFGVSLEEDLLRSFDRSIAELGYANRSEAIRDLIRNPLLQKKINKTHTKNN